MNISLSTSVSGIQAAQIKQNVTGHNLANVNTPGFEESRTTQSETKGGGTKISSIDKIPHSDPNTSGTQIDEQMVNMIKNEKELGFNVKAIKVQDQMLGELLDIKR